MTYRKKLIEVALPLDAINREASREKSIRHGHPSTLHLWWSRKPLAACRAVLFSSLVDDPSSRPDEFPTEDDQQRERERLFDLIEELVKWENVNNEHILGQARKEILKSTDGNPPPVLDPFCGGGSIPLEAQRLGLEAHASDLNPVAVLITKAMIEIPPRFAGQPPVNPDAQNALAQGQTWRGATGLAEDVRYYGKWMRDETERRIGHLYPKVTLPQEEGGGEATVIAWLWARTVKCPNPACGATMPLVNSFWLSKKEHRKAWIEPIINGIDKTVKFEVRTGNGRPPNPTQVGRGARFQCLVCHQDSPEQHIKSESTSGRMGSQLMAIAAEGKRGRIFFPPLVEHSNIADSSKPDWIPDIDMNRDTKNLVSGRGYGFYVWADLFTQRQLLALTTFSDLMTEARKLIEKHAIVTGCEKSKAYANAITTYLALALDKAAESNTQFCTWSPLSSKLHVVSTFGIQALPMIWDYAEANPFANSAGNFSRMTKLVAKVLERQCSRSSVPGITRQGDASRNLMITFRPVISTDPPYYDNIGYAELSDFFYLWLRRNLKEIYPDLFNLMLVPKTEELVATPYRFGGDKRRAEEHFLTNLRKAFHLMRREGHPDYPMTVYYAFKQSETDKRDGSVTSTGWETMLEGLFDSGFQITGTWPMRTERAGGFRNNERNALASSIVLVCRTRPEGAETTTRRDFMSNLRRELPKALHHLQGGNIAPVDLAQAAIGPGMAVFSRFSNVLEADGNPMRVRTALQIINAELDAYFAEQEGDLDADTRFCTAWFEQHSMGEGAYGEADVLARAKNSSVEGVAESRVLRASAGKVRLLNRDEYPDEWNPTSDGRLNTWKCTQYLIRTLDRSGETEAGRLVNLLGGAASEAARALAYRLYAICDRKGWAQEAKAYNTLVSSWTHIQAAAAAESGTEERPGDLF